MVRASCLGTRPITRFQTQTDSIENSQVVSSGEVGVVAFREIVKELMGAGGICQCTPVSEYSRYKPNGKEWRGQSEIPLVWKLRRRNTVQGETFNEHLT
jgi:hypothetical protein